MTPISPHSYGAMPIRSIMAPARARWAAADAAAVVDSSLRVRGVEGLRVADASIMPEVVNATTNAACVMIGEKASELVRLGR